MEDREHLELLLTALDASDRKLRRDECGDLRIEGRAGHIYRDGAGYLIVVSNPQGIPVSVRRWTNIKRILSFCKVTQDGDDEGCLHLRHLPEKEEAAEIRDALDLKRKRAVSEETLTRLAEIRLRRKAS